MTRVVGLIDVGFVRASVAQQQGKDTSRIRLDVSAVVALMARIARNQDATLLRSYWYDGQYAPDDRRHASQRRYLDAVGSTPGIQLRLGTLVERIPSWHGSLIAALNREGVNAASFAQHFPLVPEVVQKGVDTLIVLDLVLMAQRNAYDVAVLFAGDRDLADAVQVAQGYGCKVVVVSPAGRGVSPALATLADEIYELAPAEVCHLALQPRDSAQPLRGARQHPKRHGPSRAARARRVEDASSPTFEVLSGAVIPSTVLPAPPSLGEGLAGSVGLPLEALDQGRYAQCVMRDTCKDALVNGCAMPPFVDRAVQGESASEAPEPEPTRSA